MTIQDGLDWHEFRKGGVGSSDVPVLMGYHEFHTPYTLWLEKTSETKTTESNFIQQKGKDLEIQARAKFNLHNNFNFEPKLFLREGEPFRCSLDGYDADLNQIIEIKYVGKEFNSVIPDHHLWQMQYQLMVSGASCCFYVQIRDDKNIHYVQVTHDLILQETIKGKVLEFWKLVETKKAPPFCKDDVLPLAPEKVDLIKEYIKLREAEDKIEELKKEILKDIGKFSYQSGKYKITYSERKGAIDYDKIEVLKSIDLEKYRKKPSSSWAIKEVKNEIHQD